MTTMNVSLPETMKSWVETQVKGEQYANSSDYIRALIRRDIERREQITLALIEGEKSGISTQSIDDIWNAVKAKNHNAS